MTTIITKNSSTASSVPSAAQLTAGELAVNLSDKRLFSKTAGGTVIEVGTNPSALTLPNGTANAIPYLNGSKVLTGGTALQFDGSNLGLGVTPSAWGSAWKVIQTSTYASLGGNNDDKLTAIGNNFYNDGVSRFIGTGQAALYTQYQGQHRWYTAPSGTAGNAISFTQAMTLDASGNLVIGNTSAQARLSVRTGSTYAANFNTSQIGSTTTGITLGGYESDAAGSNGQVAIRGHHHHAATAASSMSFMTHDGSNLLERARIDSSGNLLVGTTATTAQNAKQYIVHAAANTGLQIQPSASSSGSAFIYFNNEGATVIGGVTRNGTTNAVLYNTTSDYRLKEQVTPLSDGLAKVMALKPVKWVWKNCDGAVGEGFIAHEVQEIVPSAVSGKKDAVNEDGSIKAQGMDASYLVATLTAAIQEQQVIIQTLTARVEALEAK